MKRSCPSGSPDERYVELSEWDLNPKKRNNNIVRKRGMPLKIFGLYGKSGTGKSCKVRMLASRLGVSAIIDDGILIVDGIHVAGFSAKCEQNLHAATKRAIFFGEKYRNEVLTYIREREISELIVIGTSIKMLHIILERLEIRSEVSLIHVESVQTVEEIEQARVSRENGFHVIPINPVNVEGTYTGWFKVEALVFDNSRLEIVIVKPFEDLAKGNHF
uniref:hypothetical protein n=1 Tax=Paenibacillus marchantiophytorum TaxID=1619310 RepID=UPI0016686CF2|nr:hypothetical protein [Paenibacillus marchantiophytorum]